MEASVQELAQDNGEVPEEQAEKTVAQLFRYSTWVHVGPGAENCPDIDEEKPANDCGNPLHFHAWCRLPNQFQHREVREKGLAAKARTARRMRDEESDAYEVLEAEIDDLRRLGEEGCRKQIVDELASKDWWKDVIEAQKDVLELEVDDEKPYAHIEEDQKRFQVLDVMPEGERPADEFEELIRHLGRYQEALRVRVDEIMKPRREALESKTTDELIELIRQERIDVEAQADFMHVYNVWEWYLGTLKVPRGERVFKSIEHMEDSAPEVIEALQAAFTDLEAAKAGPGNS